jgi:hypothetical protein
MKKIICKNCGVVNEVDVDNLGDESDDWLECTLPEGFEWILPVGKISPVIGDPIYISGHGEHLSRSAYLEKYNLDPEITLGLMRGTVVRQDISKMLGIDKGQSVEAAVKTSSGRIGRMFDEDDWEM